MSSRVTEPFAERAKLLCIGYRSFVSAAVITATSPRHVNCAVNVLFQLFHGLLLQESRCTRSLGIVSAS